MCMSLQILCLRPTKPPQEWALSFSLPGRSLSFLVQMRTCAISILTLALLRLDLPQMPKMLPVHRLCICVRRSLVPTFGFLGCFSECRTLRCSGSTLSFYLGLGGAARIHPLILPMLTCTSLPLWTLVPFRTQGWLAALFVGP